MFNYIFYIFFVFIYFKHSFSIVSLRGKKKQLHNLNRLKRFALWTQCQVDYNILLRKLSQANWIQGFLKNIIKVLSEFVFYRRKLSLKIDSDRNGQTMNICREIKDWNKTKMNVKTEEIKNMKQTWTSMPAKKPWSAKRMVFP